MSGSCGCGGHRVAQEDHPVDLADGQPGADLQVAAERAAQQAFDDRGPPSRRRPPVVPVAISVVRADRRRTRRPAATMASFFRSWAIRAMFMTQC